MKLPPVKLHCSMLAEDAIRAAVSDWKAKHDKKKMEGGEGGATLDVGEGEKMTA